MPLSFEDGGQVLGIAQVLQRVEACLTADAIGGSLFLLLVLPDEKEIQQRNEKITSCVGKYDRTGS